jgi:hypothetical protein
MSKKQRPGEVIPLAKVTHKPMQIKLRKQAV